MCKIGIIGNRGTGRKTAAWLLAQTIEERRKGTPWEKYKVLFESWVKLVIIDPAEATSTDHVVLDSFGEHILDQIKQFCPALIEYDLHDEATLKGYYINPATFDVIDGVSIDFTVDGTDIYTAKDYADYVSQDDEIPSGNIYMDLSEFILYFAHYTMKRAFGPNVWLNIATATADAMGSTDTRIYWDVKTQAELDYISRHNGIIIELRNSDREHDTDKMYRDIKYLDPDMIFDTTLGLHGCAEMFWNATNNYNYGLSEKNN